MVPGPCGGCLRARGVVLEGVEVRGGWDVESLLFVLALPPHPRLLLSRRWLALQRGARADRLATLPSPLARGPGSMGAGAVVRAPWASAMISTGPFGATQSAIVSAMR